MVHSLRRVLPLMTILLAGTVATAQLHHFKVEAVAGGSIGKQRAATAFSIKVTAQKIDNSTETAFTGKVMITSSGTLAAGGDSTAVFTAGVLASHSVTFGNTGSFTITAAHDVVGTSNTFIVNAFTSDDFNAYNLKTGIWSFSDPVGDATLTLVGTGTANARLSLAIPAGVSHDLYTGNNTAPRILQPAANTDFAINVKFDSPVSVAYQVQGVIVQQDINNVMRFDFSSNGSFTKAYAATTTNGFATTPTEQISAATTVAANNTSPLYMRVNRSGDTWTLSASTDGSTYTPAGSFSYPIAVTQVGLFVANGGSPIPAHTVLVDYFFDQADPVTLEDGSVLTDVLPPLVYNLTSVSGAGIRIDWKTDELSKSRIEYGTTPSYGSALVDDNLETVHSLELIGLSPNTPYNFRVIAIDGLNTTTTTINYKDTTGVSSPPLITLWYGNSYTFGKLGTPQRYVNIPGNVTDAAGIDSFYYRVNGGAIVNLTRGPDTRRLQRAGDFNIDIAFADLNAGSNAVKIRARNLFGEITDTTITVTNSSSAAVWPLPYKVTYSSPSSLSDSVQVTDGLWEVSGGAARVVERGYDRVIAIGDTTWQDYEITAKMTIAGFDSSSTAYDPPSNGPAIAFLMRWKGHTNSPLANPQPLEGYLPLGAFTGLSWPTVSSSRWELLGNNLVQRDVQTSPALLFNTPYFFKMQVKTIAGQGGYYRFKVWKASDAEPGSWLLSGQETLLDPQKGSVLIVAHHVSAIIDEVTVTADMPDLVPPVISNVQVETSATSAYVTWTTDEPARSKVAFGLTAAYGDTAWNDTLAGLAGAVGITGLTPSTTYYYKVLSTDLSGNLGTTTDVTLTTGAPATPTTLVSDEFNTTTLNGMWTFVDPRSDATVATPDTVVKITVPAGIEHDIWTTGYHAPRIMQAANNTDLEVDVKWNSAIVASSTEYRNQGIVAEQDPNNLVRFDFTSSASGTYIFAASFQNGFALDSIKIHVYRLATGATGTVPLFMRVKREGNIWSQWYSTDGTTWTRAATFHHVLTVSKVGLFAGNSGSAPPTFTAIVEYFRTDGVTVNLKAYLQGPYVAAFDTMQTLLGAGIPLAQPYSGSPWNYSGTESVGAIPAGVVDWVLVTLRSGTAANTGVDTVAAFIKKDGAIVGLDGTSPVFFPGVKFGSYYTVVRHRNHLAIMTATALALNRASALYDFTTAQSKAYSGGADGLKAVGTKFAMFAGNGNGDGSVNATDRNAVWRVQNGFINGYYNGDFNLDVNVNATDRNDFWRVNNGTLSRVP